MIPLKLFLTGCLLLAALAVSAYAQPTLPPAQSMSDYRPMDNLRVWTFTYQAQDMGRLVSFIDGETEINDRPAIRIDRKFTMDYKLLNESRQVEIEGSSFVARSDGTYLGDDIRVTTDTVSERLKLEVDDRTVGGFFTRGGTEVERSLPWPADAYAWDANFVDQLEIFLPFQPISVGAEFVDSVFQPQSLLWTRVAGYCDDYYYMEIYRNKFDTVYAIHLTEPMPMDLYYTPKRELVRADFLAQAIRVYQDLNAKAQPEGESRSAPTPPLVDRFSMERVGQYLVYIVIGLLGLAFFVRGFFRRVESYLALAIGGAIFLVVLPTQVPLQENLLAGIEGPLGLEHFLLPTAVAAVIQEVLKLVAIGLVIRLFRPQPGRTTGIGAAVGAAFGVVEAIYMAGLSMEAASFWFILRDGSLILFHVVSGYLLGTALEQGGKRWLHMLGLTILLHLVIRFLPALSFVGMLDQELAAMFMAVAVLLVLIVVLMSRSKQRPRK